MRAFDTLYAIQTRRISVPPDKLNPESTGSAAEVWSPALAGHLALGGVLIGFVVRELFRSAAEPAGLLALLPVAGHLRPPRDPADGNQGLLSWRPYPEIRTVHSEFSATSVTHRTTVIKRAGETCASQHSEPSASLRLYAQL